MVKQTSSDQARILVVDDDELVSEYLAALLQAEDYDVTVFNESAVALNYFKNHPDNFDLILTDQIMPQLTGVEIAQEMLKLRPDIPILLITGYSDKISAQNASSFGLKGYFAKPINEAHFLTEIKNILSCQLRAS